MRQQFAILALLVTCPPWLCGQTLSDPSPKTGIHTTGLYSVNDIETLDHVSGNLMLNIPLGTLGPDRSGSSHGLSLVFNSHIWDASPAGVNPDGSTYYHFDASSGGGWNYPLEYRIEQSVRFYPNPICNTGSGVTDEQTHSFKNWIVFPDGSKHLLRLQMTGEVDVHGDGYYKYANKQRGLL
jgi:hypothetical protein